MEGFTMQPVNCWAIVAAVVANFIVGGLWYSPALFVRGWLKMAGVDKATFDAGLPKALAGDLFTSVAVALGLNQVLRLSGAVDLVQGLVVAFWVWLAFVGLILLTSVTYEHRPLKFFAINAGYRLVSMLIMGAILAVWH
jgi:Protein of unknown function (DUF1761)